MYGFASFYFFFFVLYAFYSLVIGSHYKNNRKRLIVLLFIPLYLLEALRGESVGGDLDNYLPMFDSIARSQSFEELMGVTNTEPGYTLFCKFISCISDSRRFFLIVISFVSLTGPFFLIYKYSNMPVLSVLLYFALGFYTNTYNNLRQSLALSICFMSVPFLLGRKGWKFLLMILLASSMHYSALFFGLIYPILSKDVRPQKIVVFFIIIIATFLFAKSSIIGFIINSAFVRYDPESLINEQGQGWGLFSYYLLLFLVEWFGFSVIRRKLPEDARKMSVFYVELQLMAIAFQMYATMWASMTRVTYYFYIPIILAAPFYCTIFKKLRKVLILAVLCLALIFMRGVFSNKEGTNSNSQGVIPYVLINTKIF